WYDIMTIAGITIDYSIIWLAAVIILAVIEAATMGLTSIWFAGGAFAAAIAALLGGSLPIQIIVFFAVSVILLIVMKPIVKRKFNSRIEKTNIDALIGSEGSVEKRISHLEPGVVKADGKLWSAVCDEGKKIDKGAVVVIKSVRGVTLTVEEKR
ncbi:MAG TPA: NfeD family protein, partial [Candidatus Copromorpha excrementavium]|nr:NfeD family protein [Candidatus Copromorpha excrementavium]